MNEIKPIETVYNGYRFRSRLEARWAVFFDAAGIKYEYEPEGFELSDGTRYLPDFYLSEYDWYVEVKAPRETAKEEIERASKFIGNEIKVLLLLGNIPPKTDKDAYHYSALYFNPVQEEIMCRRVLINLGGAADQDPYTYLCFTTFLAVDRCAEKPFYPALRNIEHTLSAIHDRDMYQKYENSDHAYCDSFIYEDDGGQQFINNCYDKARQARFEHGETPKGKNS